MYSCKVGQSYRATIMYRFRGLVQTVIVCLISSFPVISVSQIFQLDPNSGVNYTLQTKMNVNNVNSLNSTSHFLSLFRNKDKSLTTRNNKLHNFVFLTLHQKIAIFWGRREFQIQRKMTSASSSSAKHLFADSKSRLAERVNQNVSNIGSVARQIVRGSKSNEVGVGFFSLEKKNE